MSDFFKNIHLKNKSEVLKYSKSVVSSSNSLKDFFQNIFVIVALFKNVKLYNETFYYHPCNYQVSLKIQMDQNSYQQ